MISPTTVGLLAPKSKAVQLGGVGSSGDALGECWGALGGSLEGLWGGLPCPPCTGVLSVQELLEGLGAG